MSVKLSIPQTLMSTIISTITSRENSYEKHCEYCIKLYKYCGSNVTHKVFKFNEVFLEFAR